MNVVRRLLVFAGTGILAGLVITTAMGFLFSPR